MDGESTEIVGTGVPAIADDGTGAEASTEVTLAIAFAAHDGDVSRLELWWTLDTPTTKVVLTNNDEVITGDLNGDSMVSFSLSTWSSARSFFALGVEHIQFGPDHLLFLIVLTIAAVGTTVTSAATRRTVKLVTTFTIGHAISLALAYFEVVSVPASVVEPAIALSIVAAAMLTLRGKTVERPILAGFVGLVHGVGFASNLNSLGVAASKQITAIAAFNLGVDIAQTVVVLVVIGALWLCTKFIEKRMSWVRTAIALSTAAIGLTWTVSRLVEISA